MTTRNPRDDARHAERQRAIKSLTEALEAEEPDEKDFHVRQALQLLALDDK